MADDVAHFPFVAARLDVPVIGIVNDVVEFRALGARYVEYSILRKRHWNVIVGAATLPLVQRPRNPVLDTHLRCQNDLLFLGSCCFTMALVLQARYDDGD